MRRGRRIRNLLLLAWLAFCCGIANAYALDQPTNAAALSRGCAASCVNDFRNCAINAGGNFERAACDTGFIRCTILCQDCASAFMKCTSPTNSARAPSCEREFQYCREPYTTASVDASDGLITFEGGDGSSLEKAVVIRGARDTREGLSAQSLFASKMFWGLRRHNQNSTRSGQRTFDQIEFINPQGERRTLFFDVTDYHGKHR